MVEASDQTVTCLGELISLMALRCDPAELDLIRRAYQTAEQAHVSQTRSTSEPYITHPLAVAGILADIKLDAPTIAAALLHDVVEDTPVTLDDIRARFGDEIAHMVDAVTKLSQREGIKKDFAKPANGKAETAPKEKEQESETFAYRTNREAESLRKMMLGLVDDVRVVLIKLADRLHNMRTLDALPAEKQRRIARETLDIYAPLANRLGIWEWKQELEDLGFRYAEPDTYGYLCRLVEAGAQERERRVRRYIDMLRAALADAGVTDVEITGRAKQIYSIWRKMQRKGASFDQINDAQAIRVIIEDGSDESTNEPANGSTDGATTIGDDEDVPVEQVMQELNAELRATRDRDRRKAEKEKLMGQPAVQNCYVALGVVHRLWKPVPGEFDDYIAVPKDNHYQSLHTAVIADDGKPLEVQIRTRSMHRAAEFGLAAHWLYKDASQIGDDYQKHIQLLREAIRSIGNETDDADSFVDALKTDQFKDTVFCFTPKGKLIELPAGSTILDFAYRIHTDIGDHCRGGKVHGVIQPLTYKLKNGDQVEIITRPNATPSRDWLHDSSYAATNAARSKIRQWFRKQDRAQNIAAGKEMIERELKRLSVSDWMKPDDVYQLFKVEPGKEDDFLEKLGYGNITLTSVTSRIIEEERRRKQEREDRLNNLLPLLRPKPAPAPKKGRFIVTGVPDMHVQAATCCSPVPGDDVVGYVTRGQGIKVHRRDCKNIANAEQERLIDVTFVGDPQDAYPVQFMVDAAERPGLLAELTSALAEKKINILNCNVAKRDLKHGQVKVWILAAFSHLNQVAEAMNRMKQVKNVFEVTRVTNGPRQ
jgi:GTP pyrophosphokinase